MSGSLQHVETDFTTGRWPTNFILTHSLNCNLIHPIEGVDDYACVEGCPVKAVNDHVRITTGSEKQASRLYQVFNPPPFHYSNKVKTEERTVNGQYNDHPTVKVVRFMRYLLTLVTPPKEMVLDPFAGSGSTLVAAIEEGFDFLGIEERESYVRIAEHRISTSKKGMKVVESSEGEAVDSEDPFADLRP